MLSDDGVYRYALTRLWGKAERGVVWIMLNPSTANAGEDDATLRKIQRFTRAWGYEGLAVVNLFALRARNPKRLENHPDPVGPANDLAIRRVVDSEPELVIAAWGSNGVLRSRALIVREKVIPDVPLHILRLTQFGQPVHPLYLPETLEPTRWVA